MCLLGLLWASVGPKSSVTTPPKAASNDRDDTNDGKDYEDHHEGAVRVGV